MENDFNENDVVLYNSNDNHGIMHLKQGDVGIIQSIQFRNSFSFDAYIKWNNETIKDVYCYKKDYLTKLVPATMNFNVNNEMVEMLASEVKEKTNSRKMYDIANSVLNALNPVNNVE